MSRQSLRVVHIASGDRWAGAEVQLFTLVSELLLGQGLSVSVLLLNEGSLADRLRERGIAVTVFPESRMGFLRLFLSITSHLRANRPALIHTHRQKENILGACAGAVLGIPSVRTVHGSPESSESGLSRLRSRLISAMDHWAGRYLQRRIIAVSEDLRDKLAAIYPPEKLVTILNGVDVHAMRDAAKGSKSESLGESQVTHIGIAGRLEAVKRVDLFLEAAAELIRRGKHTYAFHVFGDGALRNSLESHAVSLGIGNQVRFHGHCGDMPPLLSALDVLVMSSDHEGLPMVAMEAIAVGTPVVAHAVGGLVPLIEGNCGGTLVTEHEPNAYADALENTLSSDVDQLMACGIDRLTESYSSYSNARQVIEIYAEALQRESGSINS